MFCKLVTCLSFFAFGICAASAQDLRKVNCRFLALNFTSPPTGLISVGEKGAEFPITVTTNSPSDPVACFATGNKIGFLAAADKKPAAIATLPPTGGAFILLFVKGAQKEGSLPWQVFVIEDSPKNFPAGGAYVVNFYKDDIRFSIGEHKIKLPSAGAFGVKQPQQVDNFNMTTVMVEFEVDKKWKVAQETMIRILPNVRYLMCAYIDPITQRPCVTTSVDIK